MASNSDFPTVASNSDFSPDEKVDISDKCSLKVLIPSSTIGSIMGKNGDGIRSLEVRTGTKIKMSGLQVFYPGTKDIVCLISGNIDSVLRANRIVMQKMFEHPEFCYGSNYNTQNNRVCKLGAVKLLIPQCTASRLIGKSGNNIKKMKEESGSFIQLSKKATPDSMLRERCVTIHGEARNNDKACRLILETIAHETNADYYKNVIYSEANFPLPNAITSGQPLVKDQSHLNLETRPECPVPRGDVTRFLEEMEETFRNFNLPEETVNTVVECLHNLGDPSLMDIWLSSMIDWFYPGSFPAYEKYKRIVGLGGASPASPEQKKPHFDPSSSMFTALDPSLQTFPWSISVPKQSQFHESSTSAASGFSAFSNKAANKSDHGIQNLDTASTSTDPQFQPTIMSEDLTSTFSRSAFPLPPSRPKPEDFNRGKAVFKCYSSTSSSATVRLDNLELKKPCFDPSSSMFTVLDPSQQSSLGLIPAPKQSQFHESSASAASGFSVSSNKAATESDGIQESVSASASTDLQLIPAEESEDLTSTFGH